MFLIKKMMETFQQIAAGDQSFALNFINENPFIFAAILIWSLAWKGVALWKASRLSHKWWFIVILLANTLGILEIIYIYFIARKYTVEEKIESSV